MSRVGNQFAKPIVIVAGWMVVVATSRREEPVENTLEEVQLSIGPAAPPTAIVDVVFEGAFVRERNKVCAFVWADDDGPQRRDDVRVLIGAESRLGETLVEPSEGELVYETMPLTTYSGGACASVTCGAAEPCGGRFVVTLVDGGSPDGGVDPTRFDPLPMVIAAVTHATPGALPGRTTVTLVEPRP